MAAPELGGKAPKEALHGTVPNSSRLRVFGCAGFVHEQKENWHDKLEVKPEKGISLCNKDELHGVYLHESRRLTTTKYISFDELQFPLLR